jgi:hypothetical protein
MEKDFHYFLTFALVKMAGYENADIIAYACQFVDDNNEGQFSVDGKATLFLDKIPMDGGHYYPIMTQSLSLKSLDIYIQKYVYVPFHFLPGDNNVSIKGKRNPMNTTPNSRNALTLLDRALESGNPYQIGIALHTYADTWSHQNFTGLHEEWNAIYPWYNVFKSIAPNIGHAEAGHAPDVISDTWTDYRTGQKVVNWERALDAVEKLYRALRSKSNCGPQWEDINADLIKIVRTENYDERIKATDDFLSSHGSGPIPAYSKDEWIDGALDKQEDSVVMKPDFDRTHWHNFHQAAKVHFANVAELTKGL